MKKPPAKEIKQILKAHSVIWDFRTLATLIAAVMSYQLRGVRVKGLPIASSLPPILVNGLVIGLELTFFYSDG